MSWVSAMKKWYSSKTIWFCIIQVIAAFILITFDLLVDRKYFFAILTINGVVGIYLRWITDRPITSPIKAVDNLRTKIRNNEIARRYRLK